MFPHVIPHTPPQHCVRVHLIATPTEQNMSRRGREAVSKRPFTHQQRVENDLLGRKRREDIARLIRVTWEAPFTASDLVEKAQLLGLSGINKKSYSRRLVTLADSGKLKAVGKRGKEILYQAKGKK